VFVLQGIMRGAAPWPANAAAAPGFWLLTHALCNACLCNACSRVAGSLGVPGLADELAEPLLFCEMMVFGR
jgi:hypothetical protein